MKINHIMCASKIFDRFMFHKANNKNIKYFCKSCLQCFSSKNVLNNHKEVSLSINGAQSVRLEKGTVVFKKLKRKKKYKFYLKFVQILSVNQCITSAEIYQGSCSKNIK